MKTLADLQKEIEKRGVRLTVWHPKCGWTAELTAFRRRRNTEDQWGEGRSVLSAIKNAFKKWDRAEAEAVKAKITVAAAHAWSEQALDLVVRNQTHMMEAVAAERLRAQKKETK